MMYKWLSLSALVIVLDQLSKAWIIGHFAYGETLTVFSLFNLVLAHNTGAAFSFLNDAGGIQRWLFSFIAIVASGWIIWLLRKHSAQLLFAAALSMILGRCIGQSDRSSQRTVMWWTSCRSTGTNIIFRHSTWPIPRLPAARSC